MVLGDEKMALEWSWEILWLGIGYVFVGGIIGIGVMALALKLVPKIVDSITPNINDERELVRGNMAVATYIAQVTQAVIIGISIIIAAAVFAGLN